MYVICFAIYMYALTQSGTSKISQQCKIWPWISAFQVCDWLAPHQWRVIQNKTTHCGYLDVHLLPDVCCVSLVCIICGQSQCSQGSTLAVAQWPGATKIGCRATTIPKYGGFGGPIGQLKYFKVSM